ncbi:MAG: stage III sporulation protein AG [Terrisporobacter sp.]|uniref:hypothetical protein n=1 Tax=Terrisporobacter sp. TaxID=1965305 RepID=UPI002FCCB1BB
MKKITGIFSSDEIKKMKPLMFLAAVCIIALIAISIIPTGKESKEESKVVSNNKTSEEPTEKEKKDLEAKLTEILSKISGAGDVDVLITFDSSEEIVPAYNSNTTTETTKEQDSSGGERTTTSSTENKTMITSDDKDPVVLKTSEAKVKGVIVVASGAEDSTVKQLLYDAVQTSLQVSGHQVEIYPK